MSIRVKNIPGLMADDNLRYPDEDRHECSHHGIKRLLFHVSDGLHEVLEPQKCDGDRLCICLSEWSFLGHLGQWLYIFEFGTLIRSFHVSKVPTGGLEQTLHDRDSSYHYRSKDLVYEYRIYKPISVENYAIGVAQNFEITKGVLEHRINDALIRKRQVDWLKDEVEL